MSQVEYFDPSGDDKVFRSVFAVRGDDVLMDANRYDKIPEEFMERLNECLGDGQAKVTVGGDLALNDYGNKAGAFVSITVTCGNSEEELEAAHGIASEMKEDFLRHDLSQMEAMLGEKQGGKTEKQQSAAPAKAREPAKQARPAARGPGRRPAAKPSSKAASRPSFQRT
jgi:hypothetical protein